MSRHAFEVNLLYDDAKIRLYDVRQIAPLCLVLGGYFLYTVWVNYASRSI